MVLAMTNLFKQYTVSTQILSLGLNFFCMILPLFRKVSYKMTICKLYCLQLYIFRVPTLMIQILTISISARLIIIKHHGEDLLFPTTVWNGSEKEFSSQHSASSFLEFVDCWKYLMEHLWYDG